MSVVYQHKITPHYQTIISRHLHHFDKQTKTKTVLIHLMSAAGSMTMGLNTLVHIHAMQQWKNAAAVAQFG